MPDPGDETSVKTGALEDMAKLMDIVAKESCTSKAPFIKLGTGTAPALNYNIPQTTCFSTYGYLKKNLPVEYFTALAKTVPPDNYFTKLGSLTPKQIADIFGLTPATAPTNTGVVGLIPLGTAIPGNIYTPPGGFQITGTPMANPYNGNTGITGLGMGVGNAHVGATGVYNPTTPSIVGTPVANAYSPQQMLVYNPAAGAATNPAPAYYPPKIKDVITSGQKPVTVSSFGPGRTTDAVLPKPVMKPFFAIVEEYRTCSYLGDYGAGRTIKTFSLFPGEKTTISVRTYKDMATTNAYSQNILDSYSQSSASSFDRLLSEESGQIDAGSATFSGSNTNSGSSGMSFDMSSSTDKNLDFNAGMSNSMSMSLGGLLGIKHEDSLGIALGLHQSASSDFSMYNNKDYSISNDYSISGMRQSNIDKLARSVDRHVNESNASRQVDVNTSTVSSVREGEENATVRELVNYNKSRTLNMVFRQLLQEYITVTYLANVRFVFCNGYPETLRLIDLGNLDNALNDLIVPDKIAEVKKYLLKHYCQVMNYNDDMIPFIEETTVDFGGCFAGSGGTTTETETFWRLKKGLVDTYSSGGLEISVKGVIMNVDKQTLRTSSLVVDALLGQGEALDCYNSKIQDADSMQAYIDNLVTMQQMNILDGITDAADKAAAYKKVFGNCCENPQTIIP